MTLAREIHLASRPAGAPTPDNFVLATTELPSVKDGQVLLRNIVMSVDPYMRGRMNDVKSYVPPFQIGAALDGGAIGEVVESLDPSLKPGDVVLHGLGWRDFAVTEAARVRKVDPALVPNVSAYLGALGMPGLTAYVGLLDIAALKPGDTVFVSGAAGAVGSLVGQIAKQKGAARVIGSAGSASKVDHLVNVLGYDAAFNYKDAPVREQLRAAAPDGIDVYFDNVGGDHLEAALGSLNTFGRVAMCGAISQYNAESPQPGPRNLALAVTNRLTLRGFIIGDHSKRMGDFIADMGPWLADGRVKTEETVVSGLENAPAAFIGMMNGTNLGKMVVTS